jgi:hypothetical protein
MLRVAAVSRPSDCGGWNVSCAVSVCQLQSSWARAYALGMQVERSLSSLTTLFFLMHALLIIQ